MSDTEVVLLVLAVLGNLFFIGTVLRGLSWIVDLLREINAKLGQLVDREKK